jgi:epsilon-lactone hydrolase
VQRFMRLDWEKTADWDLARLRDDMNARPFPRKFAKRARGRDETLGGVPACVWEPPEKRGEGVVFYFHGGSFIYGSGKTTHAEMLARLACEAGVEVISLEYRLAPEHPFPAQIEDALAAWGALVAKVAPERVVMGGDSAGGNLAAEVALALRDRKEPLPRALLLLSPWADLAMPGASYVENEPYDFGRREELVRHAAAYAGSAPLDDPRVSPIHAKLEGLPPAFVARGACEIPRDDIAAFTKALRDAGVAVTEHVAEDMPHNAAFFADYHPSARAAFDAIVRFVRDELRT